MSGRWLLSAIAVVIGLAAVCGYLALCLLFYQGSWQLIFRPSRTVATTPASLSIAYDDVRFDYTETGKPQLAGWWIPAGADGRYATRAILLLRDGRGSISDSLNQIQALHALGINIFAFDYRGFGHSADAHPSEQRMNQDADAAIDYLTGTRHWQAHSFILYGTGLGASIATTTAARHPEIPAVVLENISPDALTLLAADARTKMLPVRLLTSDRLDPAIVLAKLKTPKLFLERGSSPRTEQLFRDAEFPKQLVQLNAGNQDKYLEAMQRFLDEPMSHP